MYRHLAALLFLTIPAITVAGTESDPPMSRGEMLYRNFCIECHNQQIHWRDARIAKDLNGIEREVKRWQSAIGAGWNNEDINEVSRYLNRTYYLY